MRQVICYKLFKLLISLIKAGKIIRRYKPDLAVGTGGYASSPALKAAAGKGIPTILQEQNSYAGITNRILGKKATSYLCQSIKLRTDFTLSLTEILATETMNHLSTLLHNTDRLSMAHSIEARLPFMDYRLVDFLASLPCQYKVYNGWTKYIARHTFNKKLPDIITWRKDKVGFPNAEDYWFRGELKEWMRATIQTSEILKILGIKTNIGFLRRIMQTSTFHNGDYHTHFIDEHEEELLPTHDMLPTALIAQALLTQEKKVMVRVSPVGEYAQRIESTPWQELGQWELCGR